MTIKINKGRNFDYVAIEAYPTQEKMKGNKKQEHL